MQYYAEAKAPKRKVYLSSILDSKMMSEAEVKEEKYREHFDQMLDNFNKIVNEILLESIQSSINSKEKGIWDRNFEKFI